MKKTLLAVAVLACSATAHAESIGMSKGKDPDTFFSVVWKSVEVAAAESKTSLVSEIAKEDPGLQVTQIGDFYQSGVDGVVASLASLRGAATMATRAREAHKPLVFVNTSPPADVLGSGVAYVGSKETEAGALQMTEVCRLMRGKGTVAILMGELSHPGARGRTTAGHDVLKSPACGSVELLEEQAANWSRQQAREVVRTWLRAGVKPDAIVANNDDMALGAIDALKDAAVKGTIVAGIDATDVALTAMQAGDLSVTVLQDARQQGETAFAVARAMIAGKTVPSVTMVPFKLITPDRVAQLVHDRSGG